MNKLFVAEFENKVMGTLAGVNSGAGGDLKVKESTSGELCPLRLLLAEKGPRKTLGGV